MREEVAGAAGPPPQAPAPSGLRGRFEDLGFRIPFRVKLAVVWLVIFAILAVLFSAAKFDTQWIRDNFWFITKGLWVTIFIAVVSIFFAIILALFGALGRLSKSAIAYGVTGFYTSFFRGTPLIVQMFLIYLGLPTIGQAFREPFRGWFLLSPIVAGIVALSLNYGAYMTEIFRAGIQSVSHGQTEAAEALGMTYRQRMRRVVLPQAIRVIIPPTGNEFIAMMKDTALVTLLGTPIAWADPFAGQRSLGRADFRNLEALLIAAAWYWILTAVFSYFQSRLENRLSKGYVRQVGTREAARAGSRKRSSCRRRRAGEPAGEPTWCGSPDPARPAFPPSRPPRTRRGPHPVRPERGEAGDAHHPVVRGRRQRGAACTSPSATCEVLKGIDMRGPPGRGRGDLRPVGLGQEHAAALHQLPGGPHAGRDRGGRHQLAGGHRTRAQAGADPRSSAQRAGMVFQQFNLFPHMTVLENVIEGPMTVKGIARGGCAGQSGMELLDEGRAWPRRPRSTRSGCRAASSSAWPSRGRWRWSPR